MPTFHVSLVQRVWEKADVTVTAATPAEAIKFAEKEAQWDFLEQDYTYERDITVEDDNRIDVTPPCSDFTSEELRLRGVLQEAIRAFPQFDTESEEVSGADLVEWFAEWRKTAIAAIYHK